MLKIFFTCLCFLVISLQVFANPCNIEILDLCHDAPDNPARVYNCLKGHQDRLSPGCQQYFVHKTQESKKKNPCFEEVAAHCADTIGDRGTALCLMQQEKHLGELCRKKLDQDVARWKEKTPCFSDVLLFCKDQGLEEEINVCLAKHKKKLSGACQTHINDFDQKHPCFTDAMKLCSGSKKGEINTCLDLKISELSQACRQQREKFISDNPCYTARQKHCKEHRSPPAVHFCLKKNLSNLPKACQTKVEQMNIIYPCVEDAVQVCPNKKRKQLGQCLEANISKLSKLCQRKIEMGMATRQSIQKDCGNDIAAHCKEAKNRQGQVLKCLRQQSVQLSKACQENPHLKNESNEGPPKAL